MLLQQRIHPPSRARVVRVHRKRNRKRVLLECNVLCRTVATTPSVVTVLVSPIGGRPVEHSIGLMDDTATNLLALPNRQMGPDQPCSHGSVHQIGRASCREG